MYAIKITYSWGDEEEPIEGFVTKEEAFKKACQMAGTEAYVQNEEFFDDATCDIYFDASECHIDLHYHYDGEHCYYDVIEMEEQKDANGSPV